MWDVLTECIAFPRSLYANSVAVTRIFGPPTEWPTAQIRAATSGRWKFSSEINRNSEQWPTSTP